MGCSECCRRSYSVSFVHKIASLPTDVGPDVSLPPLPLENKRELGRILRDAGVLAPGARVQDVRSDGDRVMIFPTLPGVTTYWHSVILTLARDLGRGTPRTDRGADPE
jgi:hypothetical protein